MDSQDYFLEATYADGYVYKGTRQDVSLFDARRNCFWDVEQGKLEGEHGRLVNWAVVGTQGTRYDLDMLHLAPDAVNVRPILHKKMERDYTLGADSQTIVAEGERRTMAWVFGAQWNDADGKNHQLKEELDLQGPVS